MVATLEHINQGHDHFGVWVFLYLELSTTRCISLQSSLTIARFNIPVREWINRSSRIIAMGIELVALYCAL